MNRRPTVIAFVLAITMIPAAAFAAEDTSERDTTTAASERVRDGALERLKARADQMIDRQMDTLGRLRTAIANSDHITESHAATLSGDITAAAAALDELAGAVDAATTIPEVWEVIRAIPALHIGNVLAPKTHQVIASDALVAFGGKLDRFADKLDELITRAGENGYDVDEAWRLLEEMSDLVAEGVRVADSVAESAIGLDAGDWPDPAQSTLAAGRRDLRAAGPTLREAFGTGKEIVQFLRDLVAEAA